MKPRTVRRQTYDTGEIIEREKSPPTRIHGLAISS